MDVAGDDFAVAVSDADEGFFDLVICQAASVKEASVRGSLESFFYLVTFHFFLPMLNPTQDVGLKVIFCARAKNMIKNF